MNDETNKPKLGKLAKGFPMRDIWPNETDFSAWLAEADGLVLLGETLEMDLDEAETEKQVGPFSADVVCRNAEDTVVVENQFGRTDHDHLGKLLTYSAGLESATIVWIAETFVTQHRAALDWLNAQTVQEVRFFGLEIGLCKIEGSPLAPQFRIVSQPNDWTRPGGGSVKGKGASAISAQGEFCQKYWQGFFAVLNNGKGQLRRNIQVLQERAFVFVAQGGLSMLAVITPRDGKIRADLRVPAQVFEALLKDRDGAEEEAQKQPEWDVPWNWLSPSGNRRFGYVRAVKENCDLGDQGEEEWPEQHQWLKNQLELLYRVFRPRIQNLEKPGE